MSIESLPVSRLVLLALAEGYLTPEQAMETCLAYGQSIEESKPFEVERFWLRYRWLTPAQIEHLGQHYPEWSLFHAPRTKIEDRAVLLSIQQLLRRQHETPQAPHSWGDQFSGALLDTTDDFSYLGGSSDGVPAEEEETETDAEEETEKEARHTLQAHEASVVDQRPFLVEDTEVFPIPDLTTVSPRFDPNQNAEEPGFAVSVTVRNSSSWDEAPKYPSTVPRWSLHDDFSTRYEVRESGEEVGGGIDRVFDRNLERSLVWRALVPAHENCADNATHFIQQMRLLGQLDHPVVPKIYDLVQYKRFLYAMMPVLPKATLAYKLAVGGLTFREQLRIFRRVCEGLVHAHGAGIVHRRITPGQILLGDDGEVFLVGWTALGEATREALRLVLSRDDNVIAERQEDPRYMAPEWLGHGAGGPEIDQYAMGVLLYRCLTGSYPFSGGNTFVLLYQIHSLSLTSPHLRSPDHHIPDPLAAICMRMLSREPGERFPSMGEVLAALDAFEDAAFGVEERQRAANALYAEARLLTEQYLELATHADELLSGWEEEALVVPPWGTAADKASLWEKEARASQARKEADTLFGAATQKYLQALEHAPQHGLVRGGLAGLFWRRYLEAERHHDEREQRFCLDMLALYDEGEYKERLDALVDVTLQMPPEAHFTIEAYKPKQRLLAPVEVASGDASAPEISLPPGSYSMLCTASEAHVRVPFVVVRGEQTTVDARLLQQRKDAEVMSSFCLVQGGEVSLGGDLNAFGSAPREMVPLADFWISQVPVTFREYIAFLNVIHLQDPVQVRAIVPRVEGREAFVKLDAEGRYVPNRKTLFAGPIAGRYPAEEQMEWLLPVYGVSWFDAILYCRWRSGQGQQKFTLPTEHQWERAAVGADGRPFPWGRHFDPAFAKMGLSRPRAECVPEPVGSFPLDCSPFGVSDMAGGVRDWTLDRAQPEIDALHEAPPGDMIARGGCWRDLDTRSLRIGARHSLPSDSRSREIGFRVVVNVE